MANDRIDHDMLHCNDYVDLSSSNSRFLLTVIKRNQNQAIYFLYYWLDRLCIGDGPARVLQRVWRRHRERRRLVGCLATLDDGMLGRVVHTLCHGRKMIPYVIELYKKQSPCPVEMSVVQKIDHELSTLHSELMDQTNKRTLSRSALGMPYGPYTPLATEEEKLSWIPKFDGIDFDDILRNSQAQAHIEAYDLIKLLIAKSETYRPLQIATADPFTGGIIVPPLWMYLLAVPINMVHSGCMIPMPNVCF